jgi:hypothetical protein
VGPTSSYLSLLRNGKKFAVVQVTADRMDRRLEAAGDWNSMVTHRVRISDPKQIDRQVLGGSRRPTPTLRTRRSRA